MKTTPRLRELDALRGIAAVAVLLFHFSYWHQPRWPIQVPWGHYGVELFFVISGYVILMTMERCHSVSDFLISRCTRLYPAYWCAVLFTAAVVAWLSTDPVSPAQVAVNLTMLQQFVYVPTLDASYWTLSLELVFYVLIASWWRWGRARPIELYCLAWIVAVSVARTVLLVRHEHVPGFVARPLLLYYGQLFICGICVYRLRSGRNALTLPTLFAACALAFLGGGPDSLHATAWAYGLVSCVAVWLVWAGSRSRLPLLCNPILIFCGDISYPLYLIHQHAGELLMDASRKYMPQWLSVVLVLCLLFATASLIHYFIETRARVALQAKLRSVFSRAPKRVEPESHSSVTRV
jgi:peptidoglycan/LPS O-acetylase OafA/YrhL